MLLWDNDLLIPWEELLLYTLVCFDGPQLGARSLHIISSGASWLLELASL